LDQYSAFTFFVLQIQGQVVTVTPEKEEDIFKNLIISMTSIVEMKRVSCY